ncbi:MAG: class I SAM-dependent methyltransferase [Deltaproteobacteria bacterium]|nr:class I SAM-dependent methyltransferase [Deltaproteobacteria bacterium]
MAMYPFIIKEVEQYAESHTGPVSPIFLELERETIEDTDRANMLTGRVVGIFLKMLVQVSGAKKVVEIGTFTGYSALMMASGLPEGGELVTCEVSVEYARIARKYFDRSPHGKKIDVQVAPALETVKKIPDGSVDFVFIDADKRSYHLYYEESLRILRQGGLIAVDNVLWYGSVLSPHDEDSRAITSFNEMVLKDERVENVILTVRDGLSLIRKV